MLRRQFLHTEWPRADDVEPVGDSALIRISRLAMATRFEIALPFGTPLAIDAAEDALDLIDELEDQLTVYREHSEVSRLNAMAFEQPVAVSDSLFELLTMCSHLTRTTNGAFDVATGTLIRAWGFHRREGRVPPPAEHAAAMRATGMKHVLLDERTKTVRFRRNGLSINFGSIGKGYALDQAAKLLRTKWGIRSALLHAGGSSALAIGAPPDEPDGWRIALRHPTNDRRTLGTVRLRDRALGTSAATYQHFEYNGKQYGHVLDPRSGWPAEGVASASIVAPTAAEADALATAAFVLGPDAAPTLGSGVILRDAEGVATMVFGLDDCYAPPGFRETLSDLLAIPDA